VRAAGCCAERLTLSNPEALTMSHPVNPIMRTVANLWLFIMKMAYSMPNGVLARTLQ
jgi:hypothetical protein